MKNKWVYISYRWDTGDVFARMIRDHLRMVKGYKCFLNLKLLPAEDLRRKIMREIPMCDIFILILSRNALARCNKLNDHMRLEITLAREEEIPVIPIMSEDFTWPEKMPEEIEYIKYLNAIYYSQEYSEHFLKRLCHFI